MSSNKELWENVLTELELSLSKANFATWFRDTHITRQDDGVIYVGVSNQFVKDWLSTKYHKLILKSLRSLTPAVRAVEYIISRGPSKKQESGARKSEKNVVLHDDPLSLVAIKGVQDPR